MNKFQAALEQGEAPVAGEGYGDLPAAETGLEDGGAAEGAYTEGDAGPSGEGYGTGEQVRLSQRAQAHAAARYTAPEFALIFSM